jgi:hypothetical protein
MSTTVLTTQEASKKSMLVMGLGAACVAAVMTVAMMGGNSSSPAAAPTQAQTANPAQCQNLSRALLVSTTNGSGTVRFRASGYVSPTFTITTEPQLVTFPLMRPTGGPVDEVMTMEGNATDLVISSPLVSARNVYPVLNGSITVTRHWAPATTCQLPGNVTR